MVAYVLTLLALNLPLFRVFKSEMRDLARRKGECEQTLTYFVIVSLLMRTHPIVMYVLIQLQMEL